LQYFLDPVYELSQRTPHRVSLCPDGMGRLLVMLVKMLSCKWTVSGSTAPESEPLSWLQYSDSRPGYVCLRKGKLEFSLGGFICRERSGPNIYDTVSWTSTTLLVRRSRSSLMVLHLTCSGPCSAPAHVVRPSRGLAEVSAKRTQDAFERIVAVNCCRRNRCTSWSLSAM
jgi:hypothetical protein